MTTQAHTETQQEVTAVEPVSINSPDLSFQDYERIRRGEKVEVSPKQSAPEPKVAQEQKKAANSDAAESDEDEAEENASDSEEVEAKEGDEAKPKRKSGYQRRIDKLNARYADEKRAREALEARLAQLERSGGNKSEEKPKAAAQSQDGKPDPDKFDTHAEYVEALADWKIEQREKERVAKDERSKLEKERDEARKAHFERVKAFAEKHDDFQEVMEAADDVPISSALEEILLSSEHGPELLYELAKNKGELARISKLSPLACAREMGRLEAKLAKSSEEKKPEAKTITKAPKPIEPVGSGRATASKSLDDPNLSFAEYEKLRREQMKRRR